MLNQPVRAGADPDLHLALIFHLAAELQSPRSN